jgi:hypothetical protein
MILYHIPLQTLPSAQLVYYIHNNNHKYEICLINNNYFDKISESNLNMLNYISSKNCSYLITNSYMKNKILQTN